MLYRNYGNNKQKLSVVGLGGISVKGLGQKKATEIINYAVDKGVNYFDVAPTYGDAQELFGVGLKGHRNKIFLACKTKFRSSKDSTKASTIKLSVELELFSSLESSNCKANA